MRRPTVYIFNTIGLMCVGYMYDVLGTDHVVYVCFDDYVNMLYVFAYVVL